MTRVGSKKKKREVITTENPAKLVIKRLMKAEKAGRAWGKLGLDKFLKRKKIIAKIKTA